MAHTCTKRRGIFLTLLIISCWIQTIQSTPDLSSYLVSSFTSPNPALPFNHITINNITGDVYIGARETLYHLSKDLTIKNVVDIGPCQNPNGARNNDIKLLIVASPPVDRLITCGSCDGFCETRSLVNISQSVAYNKYRYDRVVATSDVPTVGVVVLGADIIYDSIGNPDGSLYLFTGTSGNELPYISKHNLVDLGAAQVIRSTASPAHSFRHVIIYQDFIYYFISRENSVYLGRLCRNSLDDYFESYTEVELQCGSHDMIKSADIGPAGSQLAESMGTTINDAILYAVFSSGSSSAICVYKMIDVQQRFMETVIGCIDDYSEDPGGSEFENNYLHASSCYSGPSVILPGDTIDSVQCTAYFEDDGSTGTYYRYARGIVPLSASPIIIIPDMIATSIVTAIERHHTVVFIGVHQGYLHKMNIVNGSFGYNYESVFLGAGPVLQEMFLDESKEQITIATSSEMLILELANCGVYQSCGECIGENGGNDGDPYCGWCTLEARCTRYSECPFSDESARWLPYDALQCVSISDINPDHKLPYQHTEQKINITVEQLPDLNDTYQYQCAFDSYVVNAVTTANTVTCQTPPANQLPALPDGGKL